MRETCKWGWFLLHFTAYIYKVTLNFLFCDLTGLLKIFTDNQNAQLLNDQSDFTTVSLDWNSRSWWQNSIIITTFGVNTIQEHPYLTLMGSGISDCNNIGLLYNNTQNQCSKKKCPLQTRSVEQNGLISCQYQCQCLANVNCFFDIFAYIHVSNQGGQLCDIHLK